MEFSRILNEIEDKTGGYISVIEKNEPTSFNELIAEVTELKLTSSGFDESFQELSISETKTLLAAVFHKTMAYSEELMSITEARVTADSFLSSCKTTAKFYSNCYSSCDISGIAVSNPITNSTFEFVFYCEAQDKKVMFLATDED